VQTTLEAFASSPEVWTSARIFHSLAPPPDVRKGFAFRSFSSRSKSGSDLTSLNPPNGSWGIVNVQPSNKINTHRSNFPNSVKMKIDSNVFNRVSSNHFAEFIRSANLSNGPLFDRYLLAFHSC